MRYAIATKADFTQDANSRTRVGNYPVVAEFMRRTPEGGVQYALRFPDDAKLKVWLKGAQALDDEDIAADASWTSLKPKERRPPVRPPKVLLSLEDLKVKKSRTVDAKVRKLIAKGFSVSGKVFSASALAQLKWFGLRASSDLLTFPITVPTADDKGLVTLVDAEDVALYCKALVEHIHNALALGVSLKQQIMDAATQTDLSAVDLGDV